MICICDIILTYSPWSEDWFQEIYSKIKDHTLVTEDRCYIIHRFCKQCLHFEGAFTECFVYRGGIAFLIAHILVNNYVQDRQVHLFDTFSGMPAIANEDPSGFKEGLFRDVSLSAVKDYLQILPFIIFYQCLIPEILKKENVKDL